jgi:integrase
VCSSADQACPGATAFGPPKNGNERRAPLPDSVARALEAHLAQFRAVPVTLPWDDPMHGEPTTVRLIFTTHWRNPQRRHTFNEHVWRPALIRAGVEPTRSSGMHALRHFFASALLDAGESIKAIAEWLGHSDPAFTLRVYTHLMQSSEKRMRHAIDSLFEGVVSPNGPARQAIFRWPGHRGSPIRSTRSDGVPGRGRSWQAGGHGFGVG